MEEKVVLVDMNDVATGEMEKLEAHRKGILHRAISVLVMNSRKELLLQQRSFKKYHTPGLWSNTCCSHPKPGEDIPQAASRRLREEMGMECRLAKAFDFIYRAEFPNGLIEYEFDHVYLGYSDADPVINPAEAHDFRWMGVEALYHDMALNPDEYTIWFRIIMEKAREKLPEVFDL